MLFPVLVLRAEVCVLIASVPDRCILLTFTLTCFKGVGSFVTEHEAMLLYF